MNKLTEKIALTIIFMLTCCVSNWAQLPVGGRRNLDPQRLLRRRTYL